MRDAHELGKDNMMKSNAYFAYVFVGAWLGAKREISPEEMARVMTDVLLRLKFFFGFTDLNKTPKLWENNMKNYALWLSKGNAEKYPETWKVAFDESAHKTGSYYYFTSCPICSYLNQKGLGEIMKPL